MYKCDFAIQLDVACSARSEYKIHEEFTLNTQYFV